SFLRRVGRVGEAHRWGWWASPTRPTLHQKLKRTHRCLRAPIRMKGATRMFPFALSRRQLLKSAGCGFGYLALAGLAHEAAAAEQNPLAPKQPHFPARAKRVIMLTMRGGPSHVDTFDYKPKLAADAGKSVTTTSGQVQDRNRGRALLASPFKFI